MCSPFCSKTTSYGSGDNNTRQFLLILCPSKPIVFQNNFDTVICICIIQFYLNLFKSFDNMSIGFYQVIRALDNGDQLCDLSNGVRYGQSTIYDSGQYNEDITRFRKMVNGSFDDSEFDNYSAEFRSTASTEL